MNNGSGSVRTGTQSCERMDVQQWVNIESERDVVGAAVNDAMDVLGTVQVVQNPPEMWCRTHLKCNQVMKMRTQKVQ